MPKAMWTSDRRLFLTADGRAVEASDPTKARLLVSAGGQIPLAQAEALGLVAPAAPAEPKARGKAPANKLRAAPSEDKTP